MPQCNPNSTVCVALGHFLFYFTHLTLVKCFSYFTLVVGAERQNACPKAIRRLHWQEIFVTKNNFSIGASWRQGRRQSTLYLAAECPNATQTRQFELHWGIYCSTLAPHIDEILSLFLHYLSEQYLSRDRVPYPKASRRLHWPKTLVTKCNFSTGGGS